MHDEKIEKLAADFYDPEMPYHNFGHVQTVIKKGEEIVGKCSEEHITIDEAVVYYALLFHDAGYHEDHVAKGFDSKEAYSAELAARGLQENSVNNLRIDGVQRAILSTHCDAICQSVEDKAVRAADLWELGADYDVFKKNTLNLRKELEMMSGARITWEEWKKLAAERVELFLREDMDITSDYYDAAGNSIFHQKTRENIKTLIADESDQM